MGNCAFKLNVGRQGFGSVNPEIRIIESRIIEVLLYNGVQCYSPELWGMGILLFSVKRDET